MTTHKFQHDEDEDNFKDLFGTCKACGAEVSRSVHKKVHALVATPAALKQRTQHVKKAVAVGVPIVHPSWVTACRNAGEVLGLDEFKVTRQLRSPYVEFVCF